MPVSVKDIQNEYKKFKYFSKQGEYQIALFEARLCAEHVCRQIYIDERKKEPKNLTLESYKNQFKNVQNFPAKLIIHLNTLQNNCNFGCHASLDKPDKFNLSAADSALNGFLEWFCAHYKLDTHWLSPLVLAQNSQDVQTQQCDDDKLNSEQLTPQKSNNSESINTYPLMIYLDDRSETRKDGWMFWLVFDGKEYIKLAGSRLSKNQRIYEMYYRFSGHTSLEQETNNQDVFIKWFQEAFGRNPFLSPRYKDPHIKHVNPNDYFTGPRESLWKDTALLYRKLCAESVST